MLREKPGIPAHELPYGSIYTVSQKNDNDVDVNAMCVCKR